MRAQRAARGTAERVGERGAKHVARLVDDAVELTAGAADRFVVRMGIEIDIGKVIERIHLRVLRHQPLIELDRLAVIRRFAQALRLFEKLPGIVDIPCHVGIVHVGVDAVGRRGRFRADRRAERGGERFAHAAAADGFADGDIIRAASAESRGKARHSKKQRRKLFPFHLHHPVSYYTIFRRK